MLHAGLVLVAGLSALFGVPAVSAASVDPIIIKDNHFFYKTNGSEFYIKGVAYQTGVGGNASIVDPTNTEFTDPLADTSICDRDIPYLTGLNANTVRVYAIDTTKDHSGIYLIADLSAPNVSINRDDPEWNYELYQRYTSVIDTLSSFTNVIGFFAGNEVSNNASNVNALPFVKAAVRDTKAYIKSKNLGRDLYVGYASDDDKDIRTNLEDYLACDSRDNSIDFFGYNIYSWCSPSDYVSSQYMARTQELQNYPVPAFFSEYGCNKVVPRDFAETQALYGDNMTGVWSGGIVYEYFQEENKYGLVSIDSSNNVKTLSDYNNFKTAIASVSPTIRNTASYSATNTALRSCPTGSSNWDASPTLPPAVDNSLCDCMLSQLSCVAKSSIKSTAVGPLFDYVCGKGGNNLGVDCSGISGNGSSGTYGAYSMCNSTARLSWAFNQYYQKQKSSNSGNNQACDFSGNATTQSTKAQGDCAAKVSGAGGVAGTGTSTASPNNAGGSGSSSSKSAAGAVNIPSVDVGLIKLGAYVVFAMLAGAGVVFM